MNNNHSLNKFSKESPYLKKFYLKLNMIKQKISEKKYNAIVNEKIRLLKGDKDINQTIQALCELSVCAYFCELNGIFEYEPKRGGKKTPELSWIYENYSYNIEVKCPDYSTQEKKAKESYLQLKTTARYTWYPTEGREILKSLQDLFKNHGKVVEGSKIDDKLYDYLKSASEKFQNFNLENDINILIICCDDEDDLNEFYNNLFSSTGFFTPNSYRDTKNFENVDLVFLTNLRGLHNINYSHLTDLGWNFDRVFKIFFKNPSCKKYNRIGIENLMKLIPNYNLQFIPFRSQKDNTQVTNEIFKLKAFILEEIVGKGNKIIPNYDLRRYIA